MTTKSVSNSDLSIKLQIVVPKWLPDKASWMSKAISNVTCPKQKTWIFTFTTHHSSRLSSVNDTTIQILSMCFIPFSFYSLSFSTHTHNQAWRLPRGGVRIHTKNHPFFKKNFTTNPIHPRPTHNWMDYYISLLTGVLSSTLASLQSILQRAQRGIF